MRTSMKTTPSDLNALADKLRRCYQFERNHLKRRYKEPDDYRVPALWGTGGREARKKDSLWHKLAKFCGNRKIDPIHYIQWCLGVGLGPYVPPPEPNQLLEVRRMEAYSADQEKCLP